jgi:osmotically-inducible protein OsmY
MTTRTALDPDVRRAVLAELEWTPTLDATAVRVVVLGGAVTLSGVVGTVAERRAAERAAMRVRGVTAVVDEVVVRPAGDPVPDGELAATVARALHDDAETPTTPMEVRVRDGVVVLIGEAVSEAQRTAARRVVEGLRGVRAVDSRIVLLRWPAAADAEARIRAALARDALLAGDRLSVRLAGTTAVLEGRVASLVERREAEATAWASPCVTAVDDRIVVAP